MNLNRAAIFGLVGLLLVASTAAYSQEAGQESRKTKAITLRLAKGELPRLEQGCSATHGFIEQGLLRVEGVEDARVVPKMHGIKVTYDPRRITPERIVTSFNKRNPDIPLQLPLPIAK